MDLRNSISIIIGPKARHFNVWKIDSLMMACERSLKCSGCRLKKDKARIEKPYFYERQSLGPRFPAILRKLLLIRVINVN